MSNYNGTKHSSILVKSRHVSKSRHRFAENPLATFKADDTVRISKYKSTFPKGYKANFTDELFKIARVIRGGPNVYELVDHNGVPIIGSSTRRS